MMVLLLAPDAVQYSKINNEQRETGSGGSGHYSAMHVGSPADMHWLIRPFPAFLLAVC